MEYLCIKFINVRLVVIKPELECNTGLMYKKLDELKDRVIPEKTGWIVKALYDKDLDLLCKNLFNSFEDVVDCTSIKKYLEDSGALGTLLCGSGSCVFGIYKNKKEAKEAYELLSKKYQCYLCKSIKK